jgi:hypothetical protein
VLDATLDELTTDPEPRLTRADHEAVDAFR